MSAPACIALPAGAVDRTPPNYGLAVVYELPHGVAYECHACRIAWTSPGAYDLKGTRLVARTHRDDICLHRKSHHITRTWVSASDRLGLPRRRQTSVFHEARACCSCGWSEGTGSTDIALARQIARRHRDRTHAAWVARSGETTAPAGSAVVA